MFRLLNLAMVCVIIQDCGGIVQAYLMDEIAKEITFTMQRSRGPGGQNVNRTNSSVQLRWSYKTSIQLSEEQKFLVAQKLPNWISKEGVILIRSDVHRDQDMNKKETLQRLEKLLQMAFFKPKKRRPTKPTKSSRIKRQENKKRRGEIKKNRSGKWD